MRKTRLTVDLGIISQNVATLKKLASPAMLCGIIKADAYGHGIRQVGAAAVEGGVDWLGVALTQEAVELRKHLTQPIPIFLLSEPPESEMGEVVENNICPTIYTEVGLESLSQEVSSRNLSQPFPFHFKVDTGLHRVGETAEKILELAKVALVKKELVLQGVWSHLAVANDFEDPYNLKQIKKYEETLMDLKAVGWDAEADDKIRHMANSAALTILRPQSPDRFGSINYDMVRIGLALYGVLPFATSKDGQNVQPPPWEGLAPALSLSSQVAFCKDIKAGSRISYGLQHKFEHDTRTAVIPIGYADGIRRDYYSAGGEVLIRGRRCPLVGIVTMDQIMVECPTDVEVGDEVVIIGKQGDEEIAISEMALKLDAISYEIMCGMGERIAKDYKHV